jgi:hypothetical protein
MTSLILSSSPLDAHFPSQRKVFQNTLLKEYGAFNLVETISSSFIDNAVSRELIWIRRLNNDSLFPYDSELFIRWYRDNHTDPVTRENLAYIEKYVELKDAEIINVPRKKLSDLSHEFRKCLLQKLIQDQVYSLVENVSVRCYIDLSVLRGAGYVHSLSFRECNEYLSVQQSRGKNRLFLLRTSSVDPESAIRSALDADPSERHAAVRQDPPEGQMRMKMPNSEIVVLAVLADQRVVQYRLLHVMGVGWYKVTPKDVLRSFKEFLRYRSSPEPLEVCVVDLLERFMAKHGLGWNHFLICDSG